MARAGRRAKQVVTLPKHHFRDKETGQIVKNTDAIRAEERKVDERTKKRATTERADKATIATIGRDEVQRLQDAPLDVLHSRGRLSPDDAARNGVLYEAGRMLRQMHHNGGLTGVGAIDYNRTGGCDPDPWRMPVSEFAAQQRDGYRDAVAALGYFGSWVVAIVVDERKLAEVGSEFTGRMDQDTAAAIALELLRGGLTTLADHLRLLGR